jgi:hypothetical protein
MSSTTVSRALRTFRIGLALALSAGATPARADVSGSDRAAAEALFRQGKAFAAAGKTTEACDKFAESQRLDPGTGTLLELAQCDEHAGRLASAWGEYTEASAAAQKAGRADRVKFAQAGIARAEATMAHLIIQVPEAVRAVAGLSITRDGTVVGPGSMGGSIPIDPGPHEVVASAPGRTEWRKKVEIANGGPPVVIEIPLLASPLAPPVPEPAPAPPPAAGWPLRRTLGLVVGGVGLATVGVGAYFGATALSDFSDVKSKCPNLSACSNASAKSSYDTARTDGTVSTVLIIGGAALFAGGAALFLWPTSSESNQAATCVPWVGPGGGGMTMLGSF